MKRKIPEDKRPRFGWCLNLDWEPLTAWEKKRDSDNIPVVVIPLPFMSAKMKARVEKFVKEELP